jgi:hypothetical protein
MTRLLLDFHWSLDDLFAFGSASLETLKEFDELVRRTGLRPVPFIDENGDDYLNFWSSPAQKHNRGQAARFVAQCVGASKTTCAATPIAGPEDLTESWKCSLRNEIQEDSGWRTPQIILPKGRLHIWPTPTVRIRFEACEGETAHERPDSRVVASLGQYEEHALAVSDLDPWDLRRLHPPTPGSPRQHPCHLPKPACCDCAPIESLYKELEKARSIGWKTGSQYCFIPPEDWEPTGIASSEWRDRGPFQSE